MDEREIRELFATHKVPLSARDCWAVQGTPVVKHQALERLGAALKLQWDKPVILRSERDECVMISSATRQDGISDWSTGEALIAKDGITGGNYKVSGKQASYVYAMSEKRSRDRVIIKLAGLHGAYSEEEADDFKEPQRGSVTITSDVQPAAAPASDPDALKGLIAMGDEASMRGLDVLGVWWNGLAADQRKMVGQPKLIAWKAEATRVQQAAE